MFSQLFFGTPSEGYVDPPVTGGHRGIIVLIGEKKIYVDVDVLAEASGFFLQIQRTSAQEVVLENFPGGISVFRLIVSNLIQDEDRASINFADDESVAHLFEAALYLKCPCIIKSVMDSFVVYNLPSDRRYQLFTRVLPMTMATRPPEGPDSMLSAGLDHTTRWNATPIDSTMDALRLFHLETSMWQHMESAAMALAEQLHTSDFVLGPELATGSLRICYCILRLYRRHQLESGYLSSIITSFQPVTSVLTLFSDAPSDSRQEWDMHTFALECMRRRFQPETGASDEEGEGRGVYGDIPDDVYTNIHESVLMQIVDFIEFLQFLRLPPNWAALFIRLLILDNQEYEARNAFSLAFPHSKHVQSLAWEKPPKVPAAWLTDVVGHVQASEVLLLILQGYREMDVRMFLDVVENVLLARFLHSSHCAKVVLASEVMNDIVGACFEAGRRAHEPQQPLDLSDPTVRPRGADGQGDLLAHCHCEPTPEFRERHCPKHWAGQHILWRLLHVGVQLFDAAFKPQCGFLPRARPDGDGAERRLAPAGAPADVACQLTPITVKVEGWCLWDEGLLKLELLHRIMEKSRKDPSDPVLHFGRQVIMRELWYYHGRESAYYPVPRLKVLWELACWPICQDIGLIREALEYLKGTYKEMQSPGSAWSPELEETLFQMFAALDLSLLPNQMLLTPWVPAQVQSVRLFMEQQPVEAFHAEILHSHIITASEELKTMGGKCEILSANLNIVEQRTVMTKSLINDALVLIEERKKEQDPDHASRRLTA